MAVPRTLPIWGPGVERFAKIVEELSQGELKIKVYGAGELVPALGTLESVKAGEIQMGHSAAYYWKGKIPASPFFTSVPFGMDTAGNLAWLSAGGGQELYNELMAPHKVLCMPCGATGFQMGGWYNREIKSTKDLEGLKIRIPGLAATVLAEAGAKPVLLPGGEVFTSLSTGVIDAVEWVGPYHDYVMGFHKAAKYYYGSSWHEPGPLLELMINEQAWKSLSPVAQLAIKIAASDTSGWMQDQWNAKNSEYLEKLKAEGKVTIQPLPNDVLRHLKKIADKVKLELSTTSPLAKKIYDSYTTFQSQYEAYRSLAGRYQPL
jgi:TRAP-type mannitol/chloroaromatic compound transport system substrate-binding protein